ncbi:hypothetical protein [Nocardia farcinica]|uniref:hypothetical protein n=1 Tax=Nocardia farcinica TaxID=37329 RepID=UPI002455BCE6|nr:hypothetical protein [Nocardia farcinica]
MDVCDCDCIPVWDWQARITELLALLEAERCGRAEDRSRVIALADKWDTAAELGTGRPSIVAQAFAAELRKAISGDSDGSR